MWSGGQSHHGPLMQAAHEGHAHGHAACGAANQLSRPVGCAYQLGRSVKPIHRLAVSAEEQ
eukprot:349932-Chlamydomonas_euryale.AAC.7